MKHLRSRISFHVKGELVRAEAIYRMIRDALLDEPRSLHFPGILLHQKERSDQAVQLIRRSIELFPDSPKWRNDPGNNLFSRGNYEKAEREFENAVSLKPHDAIIWHARQRQRIDARTNHCKLKCVNVRREKVGEPLRSYICQKDCKPNDCQTKSLTSA
jgi:tetratricopeptide (TPR) repeat protein